MTWLVSHSDARGEVPAVEGVLPGAMRATDPWLSANRGRGAARGMGGGLGGGMGGLGGGMGGLGGGMGGLGGGMGGLASAMSGGEMNLAALLGGGGLGAGMSPAVASNPLAMMAKSGSGSAFSPGSPLFKLLLSGMGG
jgi:hypothetical protein